MFASQWLFCPRFQFLCKSQGQIMTGKETDGNLLVQIVYQKHQLRFKIIRVNCKFILTIKRYDLPNVIQN